MIKNLISLYKKDKASNYEAVRKSSSKWYFENSTLNRYIKTIDSEIAKIIDAPVGTGRFFQIYSDNFENIAITGLDLSNDMIKEAKKKKSELNPQFFLCDIVKNFPPISADLIVCYRFANLIHINDVYNLVNNFAMSTSKYLIFSIRLIEDKYVGEYLFENKIHLHKKLIFNSMMESFGYQKLANSHFVDSKPGEYCINLYRLR